MEKNGLMICCLVGLLGLLSAATGFGAEATRIKSSEVQFITATQCQYPRSPALPLLMVAQVIINASTGCICCRRNPYALSSKWTLALVFFVVSWFTFIIAFLLLLTGAALNDEHGEESMYFGSYYCYVVRPGVFAGGAALSLVSVSFGIIYYLTLSKAKSSNDPRAAQGQAPLPSSHGVIAMGQPQFPAQGSQDPVFVHEDTYMRRQFT